MSPSAIATIETTPPYTNIQSYFESTKDSFIQNHNGGNYGLNNPKQLIGNALKERVQTIDHDVCDPGDEDTFFVADLGEVYRQHMRWKKNLPRVKPFYGRCFSPQSASSTNKLSCQMQPRPSSHPPFGRTWHWL